MNHQTADLINIFWHNSQNYSLPPNIVIYTNYLKYLNKQWESGNSNVSKEIEKTIWGLTDKISCHKDMDKNLLTIFNGLVVSFVDQKIMDERKIDNLENILNKMALSNDDVATMDIQ